MLLKNGGEGAIRTREGEAPTDLQSAPVGRLDTSPRIKEFVTLVYLPAMPSFFLE